MAALASTVVNAPDQRRRDRFAARDILHDLSSMKRLRACGRVAARNDQGVVVKASGSVADGTRRAGLSGVQSCGSSWACPVCSAKIQAERQSEVAKALAEARSRGWVVLFLTLTMRHNKRQGLRFLWDSLGVAWRATTSGNQREWKADKDQFGVAGYIKLVEGTHGAAGWHMHTHVLLFLDPERSDLANSLWGAGRFYRADELALGTSMFLRWRQALKEIGGLTPSMRRGVDIRRVTSDTEVADYFAKGVYDRKGETSTSFDVTSTVGKDARHGNRTPFGILRSLVVNKDTGEVGESFSRDLALWHAWEKVSKGRSQVHWSKGLRAELVGGTQLTDQEVVEQDAGGEALATVPAGQYAALHARGLVPDMLRCAELDDTGAALRAFLAPWLDLYRRE